MQADRRAERDLISLKNRQKLFLDDISDRLTEVYWDHKDVPSWLMGELLTVNGTPKMAAGEAMRELGPVFRTTVDDDFVPNKEFKDDLGQVHVRMQQRYRGLPVVGGEVIVHMKEEKVIGVNGHFVPDITIDDKPDLADVEAIEVAFNEIAASSKKNILTAAELVVYAGEEREAYLAWSQVIGYYDREGNLQIDRIFADARQGRLLARHPQIMTVRNRETYDGRNDCVDPFNIQYVLPGKFQFGEGGSSSDTAAMSAYNGAGRAYDFYKQALGRDSYDNQGATIISTVHILLFNFNDGCVSNNAAWINSIALASPQMVYGDGDGVRFDSLALSPDVTAHEFSHGVTTTTANLVYSGESGGLNEAFSDIMAICTEYYYNQATDWQIAEDVYTPGIPGDALRYLNDPAADGKSGDYYPHVFLNNNCGNYKNCDPHLTSGIANLAFYLMSEGGQHPRGKTTINVPAIGLKPSRNIWYRAMSAYLTSRSDYADARNATIRAASDFYGIHSAVANAVDIAWVAVGVARPVLPPYSKFNIVRNGGFESSTLVPRRTDVWLESNPDIVTYNDPRAFGEFYAKFGGFGYQTTRTLEQTVTIPAGASRATFVLWLHVESNDSPTAVADTLSAQLRDTNNNVLTTLQTYSNLDRNTGYRLWTYDVTAYRGRTVKIFFDFFENNSNQTTFDLDDVSLIVE